MLRLGYKASAEQFPPARLLDLALRAEANGFDSVALSDHFQPFRHTGGHAPAALPWLGALAARSERVQLGTSVLTPTVRYHPSVVAQAFATIACLAPGRVFLGVGSGEAMNEVAPTGAEWPAAKDRLDRLEEAIVLMRRLWSEERVTHEGTYYRTHQATVYDRPPQPIPVWVAAAAPRAARIAGANDGLITTSGKARELYADTLLPNLEKGATAAGRVAGELERMIEVKLSYAADRDQAARDCRFWAALSLPAEAKQGVEDPVELERLSEAIDGTARFIVTNDPDEAVERITPYVELGFTHLVFHSPAEDQEGFIDRFAADLAPRLRARHG